jgi:predicted DCC family thiol-disulfide oxidoreductase YuxK
VHDYFHILRNWWGNDHGCNVIFSIKSATYRSIHCCSKKITKPFLLIHSRESSLILVITTFFAAASLNSIVKMKNQQLKKIIYFDGICNLCNWSVRFILKYDKNVVFLFASLQSEFTKKHLVHFNEPERKNESIVYQDHQVLYTKSDAVLKILNDLGGVWKLFYVFKIIPQNLRDWLYDFIARNRYRLFGKKDNCMIPSPEIKDRFLG